MSESAKELLRGVQRTQYHTQEKEPALKVGVTTGTIAGILTLLSFLAPDLLTDRQLNAVLVIGTFILPIIVALFTRGKVWSPASVLAVVKEATEQALEKTKPTLTERRDKTDFPEDFN